MKLETTQPAQKTGDQQDKIQSPEVSKFRRILPQVLASTAKNFLLFDLGLAVAFPTIVIPAIRGISSNADQYETLTLSATQASWLGSVAYICQPIGSLLSGLLTEPIGRKRAMIVVNIPHIIAWAMLYMAGSLEEVFIAAILLGLGVGFMEAPIITYVGEICEPSIRGILTCCAGVSVMLGITLIYFLGTVIFWRTAALICLSVPILTMIAICFVPETPMWLLSKNRDPEALKSLQWLRGWVSERSVRPEFEEICRYSVNSNKCVVCEKGKLKCDHPPATLKEKLADLLRKRTLKPFLLVIAYFSFVQFSGIHAMRPYLVQIFKAYRTKVDPGWVTVIIGMLGLLANIICMATIRVVGKRKMSLISMFGTILSCFLIGLYSYNYLPHNLSSFNIPTYEYAEPSSVPMYYFFGLAFFTSIGIQSIPWMLMSEVFPFKSRGFATGITAAINYSLSFVTTKTYLNLEGWLGLYGVIWFYCIIDICGFVFIYFLIPETEHRTLEDIETHFSDNQRKLTDINIIKLKKVQKLDDKEANGKYVIKSNETFVENKNGCDNRGFNES